MHKKSTDKISCDGRASCSVGGCGSTKGMCPGIALLFGLFVGTVSAWLTNLPWLELPLTIFVTLLLILGIYPTGGNWPFVQKKNHKEIIDNKK